MSCGFLDVFFFLYTELILGPWSVFLGLYFKVAPPAFKLLWSYLNRDPAKNIEAQATTTRPPPIPKKKVLFFFLHQTSTAQIQKMLC